MASKSGVVTSTALIATGTAIKTVMQVVAAANHAVDITGISFSCYGVNNTHAPILVYLARQTDAGTSSAATIVGTNDADGDTFDTTGRHTASVEPTTGAIIRRWTVHPQTSLIWEPNTFNIIHVKANSRVGLICDAANGVNCEPTISFVE